MSVQGEAPWKRELVARNRKVARWNSTDDSLFGGSLLNSSTSSSNATSYSGNNSSLIKSISFDIDGGRKNIENGIRGVIDPVSIKGGGGSFANSNSSSNGVASEEEAHKRTEKSIRHGGGEEARERNGMSMNGNINMKDENGNEENSLLEYGPGIVKKLRKKYQSLALRHSNLRPSLRKSASMENVLESILSPVPSPPPPYNVNDSLLNGNNYYGLYNNGYHQKDNDYNVISGKRGGTVRESNNNSNNIDQINSSSAATTTATGKVERAFRSNNNNNVMYNNNTNNMMMMMKMEKESSPSPRVRGRETVSDKRRDRDRMRRARSVDALNSSSPIPPSPSGRTKEEEEILEKFKTLVLPKPKEEIVIIEVSNRSNSNNYLLNSSSRVFSNGNERLRGGEVETEKGEQLNNMSNGSNLSRTSNGSSSAEVYRGMRNLISPEHELPPHDIVRETARIFEKNPDRKIGTALRLNLNRGLSKSPSPLPSPTTEMTRFTVDNNSTTSTSMNSSSTTTSQRDNSLKLDNSTSCSNGPSSPFKVGGGPLGKQVGVIRPTPATNANGFMSNGFSNNNNNISRDDQMTSVGAAEFRNNHINNANNQERPSPPRTLPMSTVSPILSSSSSMKKLHFTNKNLIISQHGSKSKPPLSPKPLLTSSPVVTNNSGNIGFGGGGNSCKLESPVSPVNMGPNSANSSQNQSELFNEDSSNTTRNVKSPTIPETPKLPPVPSRLNAPPPPLQSVSNLHLINGTTTTAKSNINNGNNFETVTLKKQPIIIEKDILNCENSNNNKPLININLRPVPQSAINIKSNSNSNAKRQSNEQVQNQNPSVLSSPSSTPSLSSSTPTPPKNTTNYNKFNVNLKPTPTLTSESNNSSSINVNKMNSNNILNSSSSSSNVNNKEIEAKPLSSSSFSNSNSNITSNNINSNSKAIPSHISNSSHSTIEGDREKSTSFNSSDKLHLQSTKTKGKDEVGSMEKIGKNSVININTNNNNNNNSLIKNNNNKNQQQQQPPIKILSENNHNESNEGKGPLSGIGASQSKQNHISINSSNNSNSNSKVEEKEDMNKVGSVGKKKGPASEPTSQLRTVQKQKSSSQMQNNNGNSLIIDFTKSKKELPDYLNLEGIVEDESDDVVDSKLIQFVGSNVIINGKSSILKKPKAKKVNVSFNEEATTTFEYPSELSILGDEDGENNSKLLGGGLVGSSGLGSYTPSKMNSNTYQLGNYNERLVDGSSSDLSLKDKKEKDLLIEDYLKPDTENTTWSNEITADILF